ncbi:MAG TPA: hypothetical protein VFM18_11770 [Methanosarcina sp.]|nr:hypothetical protein [Methanosarcina sp.]
MKANGNYYITKVIEKATDVTTAGGIFIKSDADTQLFEVVSVGPEIKHPISIGAKIAINFNYAIMITHKSVQYVVIEDKFVFGEV